jgi:tetratricopeptide (TPR) repeat protein
MLAACQLWLQHIQHRQFEEADAIAETLAAHYRLDQLASMVPRDLQSRIIDGYMARSRSVSNFRPGPQMIAQCERALALARFFDIDPHATGWAKFAVVRAYRSQGDEAQALQLAEKFVRELRPDVSSGVRYDLVAEYSWLLRLAGRANEARSLIDRWFAIAGARHQWQLERARILATLGRSDEAENALDEMLTPNAAKAAGGYAAGCAMRGFLRQQRGDESGALAAWKEGVQPKWTESVSGFANMDGFIVASLADSVSEDDAKACIRSLQEMAGGKLAWSLPESTVEAMLPVKAVASVLRGTFRNPLGRQYARKIAFREMPFAECVRIPPMLVAYELVRQGAFPEGPTPEQEHLCWEAIEEGFQAASVDNKLGGSQFVQLGFTWKGMTGFVGWSGVAPSLPPSLRGKVAYVMGHRYRRLGRPDDATRFFQTAVSDAPPKSPLKVLAQAELDRATPQSDRHHRASGK